MKTILKNGIFRYEVTENVKDVLTEVIFWSYGEMTNRRELDIATKNRNDDDFFGHKYTDDEVTEQKYKLDEVRRTVADALEKMETLNIPNWVGNAALAYGRDNDLRKCSLSDFFYGSAYTCKTLEEAYEFISEDKFIGDIIRFINNLSYNKEGFYLKTYGYISIEISHRSGSDGEYTINIYSGFIDNKGNGKSLEFSRTVSENVDSDVSALKELYQSIKSICDKKIANEKNA